MEKSSSSLKKKRSKKLSKVKASSTIKKSRKSKSKKVRRRREVSLSSSDYEDSKKLDTLASSSSEDSYRRKRDRSRTRKEVKGLKRKARGRSYSSDSSEDSHYARKRKKAKRQNECDQVRKKSSQKKKIKRDTRVDLMRSSTSRTCSACQDGSASSDDCQYKSHRGRSERKEKDRRKLRGSSGSKKSSRYRARSCSPCSIENSYEVTEEKYAGENNSRWLRSVITVTKEAEEYGELCRNENKDEIDDDHDYPCRSSDSNDGGTKTELDHHTLASEEKLGIEEEAGDMNADLNFTEPKFRDRSYNDSSNLKAYSGETTESMKETSETSGANVNDDDLESILRQRALENLRKFREIQSSAKAPDQKNKIVSQVKQPITDKHELVQGKSVVNDATVGKKFDKQTPGEETNLPIGRRNLIACPRNNERILNMDKDVSGSAKCHPVNAPEKGIDSDNPSRTITESTNYNNTINLELIKQTQKSRGESLQTSTSHEAANAKLLVTEGDVESNAAKTPHAAIQSVNNNVGDVDVSSVENKTGKLLDESNQGSQFEKKTMNVMRGGEMVQVSYKVYIPNKVPALARRQLKR
ncbi:hypothetical protein JHK82_037447 [Glycine max]|nr:hypothetical protein JHK86_037645 [Glycine max]KAG5114178.1 hypothetical protein JHK82_037447 [Glycine max]KAG5131457.1 hypothetical protein JHK84_037854 [Glycine max]